MAALIQRLKVGKFKFKGAERTFSTKFAYSSIITAPTTEGLVGECDRVLSEHPAWAGDRSLGRLFLVQTPESGYSLDDENSPYYQLKRSLLEQGLPSQMVDTPTLLNPDFKDLNLALNIIAKCGVVPWVLPGAIPDADFFVGLSYTQNYERGTTRTMGYANVFNNYGRWGFYSANTETFPFEKKAEYFSELVRATLDKLPLSDSPSVCFHYSAKFKREDRVPHARFALVGPTHSSGSTLITMSVSTTVGQKATAASAAEVLSGHRLHKSIFRLRGTTRTEKLLAPRRCLNSISSRRVQIEGLGLITICVLWRLKY
jgi:hypothetical protein